MSYIRFKTKVGTIAKTLKIDKEMYYWMKQNGLVVNRTLNYALQSYERALQTDVIKPTEHTVVGRRIRRQNPDALIAISARLRRDLLEYLEMNSLTVNGSVNEALEWLFLDTDTYCVQHGKPAPWLAQLTK